MAGAEVRVLVVDGHDGAGNSLAATLRGLGGFEVVGVARDAEEAIELAIACRPHVALVDARLGGGGEAVTREILGCSPGTGVVAHSETSDGGGVVDMLRAGASGYVARGARAEKLAATLRGTAYGETRLDDVSARGVMDELIEHVERAERALEDQRLKRRRIERAVAGEDLEIVFQPIIELDSREVVGHEALARFLSKPLRGPVEWFREAAEVGLARELELTAVRLACERAGSLPPGTYLLVNVSPETAELAELAELIDLAPVSQVVLEVTEHAPVDDYGRFRSAISRMREHGASLAVDDAGAGFASLRHILELDAELIKLDGSLTHSLDADLRRRSLASALIEFGRETGASLLAEGIESELQLFELRRLGVRFGQGFHLGRPNAEPIPA